MRDCKNCKHYKLLNKKINIYPTPDTDIYGCELWECIQDNNKYIKALNQGKEIVIVSDDSNSLSAMFWKKNGVIYAFNREFGILRRDDMDDTRLINHLETMESEKAHIFIRGFEDD